MSPVLISGDVNFLSQYTMLGLLEVKVISDDTRVHLLQASIFDLMIPDIGDG